MPTLFEKLTILDAHAGAVHATGSALMMSDADLSQVLADHGFEADAQQVAVIRERLAVAAVSTVAPVVTVKTRTFIQAYAQWCIDQRQWMVPLITAGVPLLLWNLLPSADRTGASLFITLVITACLPRICRWMGFCTPP